MMTPTKAIIAAVAACAILSACSCRGKPTPENLFMRMERCEKSVASHNEELREIRTRLWKLENPQGVPE